MKKLIPILALILSLTLIFSACSGKTENATDTDAQSTTATSTDAQSTTDSLLSVPVNIGFLQGPTGMGAAYLMEQSATRKTGAEYIIQTSADPTSFTAALISGELDIAAIPVNAAATLYAKTQGKVQILAVNTLGVMYILDRSGEINSVADLKGKAILSAGQGSTPEYVLNYILTQNGLTAGEDVTVDYASEHAEVVAQAIAEKYDAVLLPEPFVTKLMQQDESFKIAIDLTEEWNKTGNGELLTGCVAVRTEFAAENPDIIKAFLADYEESVNYTLSNSEEAAALMEKYEIINAAIAIKALPNCNITFIAGEEMKADVSSYLSVLAQADISSVGGSMPDDGFYCITDTADTAK